METEDSHDWPPSASLEVLKQRSEILKCLRRVFDEAGYWEVQTPTLSRDIVVDAHLDPFVTRFHPGRLPEKETSKGVDLFLQTSPEFAMKRLLAAGADAIYQIGPAFRNGEQGNLHNPEFTMVEWYRAGADHDDQMAFTEEIVREVFAKATTFTSRPTLDDVPFERLTYDEAFERFAGCRVLTLEPAELAELASTHDVAPPAGLGFDDRDGWLNLLLAEVVEPELGQDGLVFLFDYPASQAALAVVREGETPVAERFELYMDGVEVCNGYHELLDPAVLAARIREQNRLRKNHGARELPAASRLLDAMQHGLPKCSGVALGVDRLVMLALGLSSLSEVLAFPLPRA